LTDYSDQYFTNPDGLRQYYRDYNIAPPGSPTVLCMPGLTRNSRDFEDLARHLAPTCRVICAEQRGRGNSQWDINPARYSLDTYVADMMALLAHLDMDKVIAIGTSLGGLITMMMVAMHPGVICGAVINDIGPELDPKGIARIKSYVGKGTPPTNWQEAYAAVKSANTGVYPDFTDKDWQWFTRKLYADKSGKPVLLYDPAISKNFDADNEESAPSPDLWPVFEACYTIPTVVLRGELSDILSAETLAKMARLHPDLVPVIIKSKGHVPLLNETECFQAIDALIEKCK